MNEQTQKTNFSTSLMLAPTTTRQRLAQNHLLMWMDADIDETKEDCRNIIVQLQNVVDNVKLFTEPDPSIDFLTDINDIKVLLIVSSTIAQQIVSLIDDIPQLNAVYIFCRDKFNHDQWIKQWVKVKDVHTEIAALCESFQTDIIQCNEDAISISFIAVNEGISQQNLDQLEASFMYTQILKEILLEMTHNEQSIKHFITYCRNGNYGSANNITRFENEYHPRLAIWWYTFPSFIYSMLNYALRLLEASTIINIGFFIYDLHYQIEELNRKQNNDCHQKPFIVYRGQGLSTKEFEKLQKTKYGLMSFNNFLSTSRSREISLEFSEIAMSKANTAGVLFKMSIDPARTSVPFASIQDVSYFKNEEEVLFSMHTVFRINEITQIDNNRPLYEVELILTSNDDEQLRILTNHIREETKDGSSWGRLGNLLIKIGQFNKAEDLYHLLLEQTSNERDKAVYYNNLGSIKRSQGEYAKAVWYHEKALEICEKTFPLGHLSFAISYNNIGLVSQSMGEYSKGLSFFEKACKIYQKTHPSNYSALATSYNNIGSVYQNMGAYSKGLLFYGKGLEIYQKILPSNHPLLAISYNNLGEAYRNMREYSNALSFFEKACEIFEKVMPPDHPDLATCYNNLGESYQNIGEYSKAISFYEKDLEICRNTLPAYHSDLATSYNNLGVVHTIIEEYSKAILFFEKAREIFEKVLSPDHPDLAGPYQNLAGPYCAIGQFTKAVSYLKRAQDILQRSLPFNHPKLKNVREQIEIVQKSYNI